MGAAALLPGFPVRAADEPATPASTSAPPRRTAEPRLLDRIVAVVNKDVITLGQLNERIEVVSRQLRQQRVQLPGAEVLERQVLERMIIERAQLQLAEDNGIRVDDLQIDRAIERIAEQNRLSLADFRAALDRDGVSYDRLRADLRNEITLTRLREREVDSRVQVTDSEIDNFLADEKVRTATSAQNIEYRVSQVLVRIPEGASSETLEQLRERASAAMRRARSGVAFSEVAVASSDASDALQGGSIGWRNRDRLPELFVAALTGMKPGDTSEVLRSPAGFHVLHLDEVRGVEVQTEEVEQTRARHILIRTNEIVSDGEARRRIQQLHDRIAEGADFAEIARLNSDDGSAPRGGDLGWIYPGDTVPDFERAMMALKANALSDPVRSPFGWHLIQVLERRRGDISIERKRGEARRAVHDRKSDEAFDIWLRELRDRTYLEYRLEER
jgi:peptidyl-prolyl cis-trans isomerase SurA